jgi:hypothetical protein
MSCFHGGNDISAWGQMQSPERAWGQDQPIVMSKSKLE